MNATNLAARRVHTVVDSPVGPLTLVAADGALTGLYLDKQRHLPSPEIFGDGVTDQDDLLAETARQLRDYFAGRRTEFGLPLGLDRYPVPAACLGRAAGDPVRRNDLLW